jgi:drug/metabolite transporter (DMT)-like permease
MVQYSQPSKPNNTSSTIMSAQRNAPRRRQRVSSQTELSTFTTPHRLLQKNKNNTKRRELGLWSSRALLLLVGILYSTNFAAIRYLEKICFHPPCNHHPSEIAFSRFLLASIVSLPLLWGKSRVVIWGGIECGLLVSGNYITQAEALESISAGKCSFISSLSVVSVPILSYFLDGKPLKPLQLFCAFLAICGVAILEDLYSVLQEAKPLSRGDILALGQPLFFGLSLMRVEHYVEKYKEVPNRVMTISCAMCVSVCLMSFLWVLFEAQGFPALTYMLEPHRLAALAWTGTVTSVGCMILQGIALQRATATDAALIFATDPVWGSLFAGWLLGESLTFSSYVGGGIILVASMTGAIAGAMDQQQQATSKYKSISFHDDKDKGAMELPLVRKHSTPAMPSKPSTNLDGVRPAPATGPQPLFDVRSTTLSRTGSLE